MRTIRISLSFASIWNLTPMRSWLVSTKERRSVLSSWLASCPWQITYMKRSHLVRYFWFLLLLIVSVVDWFLYLFLILHLLNLNLTPSVMNRTIRTNIQYTRSIWSFWFTRFAFIGGCRRLPQVNGVQIHLHWEEEEIIALIRRRRLFYYNPKCN